MYLYKLVFEISTVNLFSKLIYFLESGGLYTCGDRDYGKLGHGLWSLSQADTTEKIIQVACGANHTVALNGMYIKNYGTRVNAC